MLTVAGTSSDDTGVATVRVNGVAAAVDATGAWTARVPVVSGTQLIQAVATDGDGNVGKESRAVLVGPLRPISTTVPKALTSSISAAAFAAIGRGLAGFVRDGDLAAIIAPSNPVIDAGAPDGPDCLYAQASITRAEVADARVALTPTVNGLALDVVLERPAIGVHAAYAVSCFDDDFDATATATRIRITGQLRVGISNGGFDVALVDQNVAVTGLELGLGGLPGEIADLLHLDTALGPIVGLAVEKLVLPELDRVFGALGDVHTVEVLGTPIDIRLAPAQLRFDDAGALIALDGALRAHGDEGAPGYVYVANEPPVLTTDHGLAFAVADDVANQLLGSLWAAGGLEVALDLTSGDYGGLGTLFDRVELTAAVPPFIDGRGLLTLTIGDLIATFKLGDTTTTQVAINARLEVKVTTSGDGAPRLDVGNPATYVDVLDENVDGANALSNAEFEAITSFALSRVIAVGSGAVGAIPLPTLGGVAVHDLGITAHAGYLMLNGNVE